MSPACIAIQNPIIALKLDPFAASRVLIKDTAPADSLRCAFAYHTLKAWCHVYPALNGAARHRQLTQ